MTDNTTLEPHEHSWRYGHTDYHGSHKGEDCYDCECGAWQYRLDGEVTTTVEPKPKNTRPSQSGVTQADREAARIAHRKYNVPNTELQLELERSFARHRQPLLEAVKEARHALFHADQFIENGIDLGYITMPDPDSNDSALETPSIVGCALQKLEVMDFDTIISEGKG